MSLARLWIIAAVSLSIVLMLSCGKDSTGPDDNQLAKTFAGKIISIDEDNISWDGLKFGLFTLSTLEVMGEVQYHAGEAFCVMDIGPDSTFSFNLPGEIESRWVFMGSSCGFSTIAYNDTNSNGVFDYDPDPEPFDILWENGETLRSFLYVSDPQTLQGLGFEVSEGWNYSESIYIYSTDFGREFMMGTYAP